MKKLSIISLFLIITQISFGQREVILKVPGVSTAQLDAKLNITDTANRWVSTLANNTTGDSLIYWIGSIRKAIPIPLDTTNLDKYLYFDSSAKTLHVKVSNDSTSASKDSLKLITEKAAKDFSISKRYRDTATASKTITSDLTVKRLLQENVHTYIDPAIPNATNAASYLTIPTYDGGGQTVHPDVWYNPNGWNGHKWWMAITSYKDQRQRFENPSLLYSDDGKTWVVPNGVTNPISAEPTDTINSFQYDTEIIPPGYDNKLRVMYGRRNTDGTSAFYTRTYDGITIGSEVKAFDSDPEGVVSPAVIEKNGLYILYYVDVYASPVPLLKKKTATNPEGPWSDGVTCAVTNNTGYDLWHLNANLIGDQVVLFLTTTYHNGQGTLTKLFFASSVNDSTFITGNTPVLDRNLAGWDNNNIYRSSAILLDGGAKRFGLYYSAGDTSKNWHTGYTEVNLTPSLSGAYLPLSGGTISGNLSINPTGYTSLRAGRNFSLNSYASSIGGGLGGNLYYDGTNWRYISNGPGSLLWCGAGGEMAVYTAVSGIAGNTAAINPRLTIFSGGGVSVGTSSTDPGPNNFYVQGSIKGAITSGTATLSAGTVTVSSTAVTSTSKILVTVKTPSGTQGFLSVPTRTAGTSFVINSTSATETSTVDWIIVN